MIANVNKDEVLKYVKESKTYVCRECGANHMSLG